MKKITVFLLAVLLFAGCAPKTDPNGTAVSTDPSVLLEPTFPESAYYIPDSAAEIQSAGAVKAYQPDAEGTEQLMALNGDVLLLGRKLNLFSGDTHMISAAVDMDFTDMSCSILQISECGIACYLERDRSIVILDDHLRENGRTELPEEMVGMPQISPDFQTVYYCTDSEIRKIDLKTGVSSLLKRQEVHWQGLIGTCFDGKMLLCLAAPEDELPYTAVISAENGTLKGKDESLWALDSWGSRYFAARGDGIVRELIFGTAGEEAQTVNLPDPEQVWPAPDMDSAVSAEMTEEKTFFRLYNLKSGLKTAEISLDGKYEIASICAGTQYVWILARAPETDTQLLFRWEPALSAAGESEVYISQRYTLETPNEQKLKECRKNADEIAARYGVDIQFLGEVAEPEDEYTYLPEHQPRAIQKALNTLNAAMGRFPENFFVRLAEGTPSEKLHIGIVRSMTHQCAGLQYWIDGNCYIMLAVGDRLEQTFYHETCHVLDTFIFNHSLAYDEWDSLNPEGTEYLYAYTYGYNVELPEQEEEDPPFLDNYSMCYPNEDRAQIFAYSMLETGKNAFGTPILQAKLRQICLGIRDAFGWEEEPAVLPWETYLQDPLAP